MALSIGNHAEKCSIRGPSLAAVAALVGDRWHVQVERLRDNSWIVELESAEPASPQPSPIRSGIRIAVFQQAHAFAVPNQNEVCLALLGEAHGAYFSATLTLNDRSLTGDLHCRRTNDTDEIELVWPMRLTSATPRLKHQTAQNIDMASNQNAMVASHFVIDMR